MAKKLTVQDVAMEVMRHIEKARHSEVLVYSVLTASGVKASFDVVGGDDGEGDDQHFTITITCDD